jgi:hypothetical protein
VTILAAAYVVVCSLWNGVEGAISMGWLEERFRKCPDCWIRTEHVMSEGDTLVVAGDPGRISDGESCGRRRLGEVVGLRNSYHPRGSARERDWHVR